MKRPISARYWSFEATSPGQNISDVLEEIHGLGSPGSREVEVEPDYLVRLEQLQKVGPLLVGEVSRIQTNNLPPVVDQDGMKPNELSDGKGFGHRSTFITNQAGDNLLWHNDQMGCSPERFAMYLSWFGTPRYLTNPAPFAVTDVWAEIESGKPIQSFSVKVASERNLFDLDDEDESFTRLARTSVDAYNGQHIDVSVYTDKGQSLDRQNVKRTLRHAVGLQGVKKAKAVISGDKGAQILDFLKRHKLVSSSIVRSEDVIDDWNSRKDFLISAYSASLSHDHNDEKKH